MGKSLAELDKEMRDITNQLRQNQRNIQALSFSSRPSSSSTRIHGHPSNRLGSQIIHQNDDVERFITTLKRRPVDMDLISKLVRERQVNPNTTTAFGDNLLHVLIEGDQIRDLEKALALGVDPNKAGGMDKTPLSQLISKSCLNLDAAEILIRAGANPDTTNVFKTNLLHRAIESRSIINVEKALALRVNPEISDGFNTPMQLANRLFSSADALVVCNLLTSAIARRKTVLATPVIFASKIMPPSRSATTSSYAPFLREQKIIEVAQPFDLNSLLNRPNSGQLICEHIQKNNLDCDSLTLLAKADSAKEQVFHYICGLDLDKKFNLVALSRDKTTGLGFFFNVYRFKWGMGTSHCAQLEALYQDLVNEKYRQSCALVSAPLPDSYLGMYSMLQKTESHPVASAPAQSEPEPLLASDPLTWDVKKIEKATPAAVPVRPEDELADAYDEPPQANSSVFQSSQ